MPWPRAIASGVVVTTLGLVAHHVAGGHTHVAGAALLPVVLLFLIVAAASLRAVQGRPGSVARTAGLLVVGQLVFHLVVRPVQDLGHSHAIGTAGTATMTHDHSAGLRRSTAPLAPVVAQWLADGVLALAAQPAMVAAHVAAAVLAGWWLARGERAAAAAARVAATTFVAPVRLEVAPVAPAPAAPIRLRPVISRGLSRHRSRVLARRGPPVWFLRTSLPV